MSRKTPDDRVLSVCFGGPMHVRPEDPASLVASLRRAAKNPRGRITYVDAEGRRMDETYGQLLHRAARVLAGFEAAGIGRGQRVMLQLRDPRRFITAFWACLLGDIVPAPLVAPPGYRGQDAARSRLINAWQLLDRPAILSAAPMVDELRGMSTSAATSALRILDLASITSAEPARAAPRRSGDDLAVILLTSGSTGRPKGVMLSHRNLLSMAAGTARLNRFGPDDVTLNWLPLDHVGAVSFLHGMPIFLGCRQVHVATDFVLRDIINWLDLLDEHRATISWAPNFAFRLVHQRCADDLERRWDLSALRFLVNAGEAVVPRTVKRFAEVLGRHGLRPTSVRPAFGMSETCSGITWSAGLDADKLSAANQHVDVGPPIPGAAIRIVDDQNRPLPLGSEGRLQVKGPSVFQGYYNQDDLTAEVFTGDGWFDTGDLGSIRDERLTITGRSKDVIIIDGVHYVGHDIETAVDALTDVETSYTAACAVRPEGSDTDRLAIFYSRSENTLADESSLADAIRRTVLETAGVRPDFVVCLPPANVPKTGIGKIQRAILKQQFEQGHFGEFSSKPRRPKNIAAPRPVGQNDLEAEIAEVWQQVLSVDEVGPDDSFFELGGKSILLPQLESRLKQRFGVEITSAEILAYPTPRALAEWFDQRMPRDSAVARSTNTTESRRRPMNRPSRESSSDIAIVGMACRFPGAANVTEFWRNLRAGRESITFFSPEELVAEGLPPDLVARRDYVKAAPMIGGIDRFDAKFFGYSVEEARLIDPQQRIFLECAWEALEDAGTDPWRYDGRIGVFGSAGLNTYMIEAGIEPDLVGDFQQSLVDGAVDFLATRTSYKLNLTGPSLSVQTACSSGLVAAHLACQSLLAGECEMALAGGASIWMLGRQGYLYHEGGLASPDGHCRAFDAAGQGMVFGNGVGLVVLKPLALALAEGDPIHAVIRGSAVNNDGAVKAGFMATGMQGQARVISEAYARADVDPDSIGYVECHGTGTLLGDAVEVAGLSEAFRRATPRKVYCAIGSVKTNIGHMGVACGIAGLIKTVLAVKHGELPPSLHFEVPNPQIPLADSPFYVNARLSPWPETAGPRRAGVSSLGLGGTNVHMVIEQPPTVVKATSPEEPHLLLLSAKTEQALRATTVRLAEFLAAEPDIILSEAAYTLQTGRREFAYRRYVIAGNLSQAARRLKSCDQHAIQTSKCPARRGRLIMFFGPAMRITPLDFQHLYQTETRLRSCVDRAVEQLGEINCHEELLAWTAATRTTDLPAEPRDPPSAAVAFAVQHALAEFWLGWGVQPEAVSGNGLGLFVAACVAGALDGNHVLAALATAQPRDVQDDGWIGSVLDDLEICEPRLPMLCARTGERLSKMRLSDEIRLDLDIRRRELQASADSLLAEHPARVVLAMGVDPREDGTPESLAEPDRWISVKAASRRSGGLRAALLKALGRCWLAGVRIDWVAHHGTRERKRISLPTYPFDRVRCWVDRCDTLRRERPTARPSSRRPSQSPGAPSPQSPGAPAPQASGAPATPTPDAVRRAPRGWMQSRLAAMSRAHRQAELVDLIQLEVDHLLGEPAAAPLAPDAGFIELGMTSVMVVELVHRLEHGLNQPLPQTVALEYPNVERLADHLLDARFSSQADSNGESRPEVDKNTPGRQARLVDEVAHLDDQDVLRWLRHDQDEATRR